MKRVIVGMILLGLASVASAEFLELKGGDGQWTTVGNWYTNLTTDAHGALPGSTDDVRITGAMELSGASVTVSDVYVSGDNVTSLTDFTITNATLNANDFYFGRDADLYNYGTINLSGEIDITSKRSPTFYNYGVVTGGSGSSLNLNQYGVFRMEGGTFTADTLSSGNGSGTCVISLNSGTMTFDDVTYFDNPYRTMNVSGGKLVVEGENMVTYFRDAIAAGALTGLTAANVTMVGENTVFPVPAGTVISIK